MNNPFAEGESRTITPPPTAMVIFGATGDLTQRKLLPALYNLYHDGYLPESLIVVGASRTTYSDEEFRESVKESVKKYSRRDVDEELWKAFSQHIYYQPLNATEAGDFDKLKVRLSQIEKDLSQDLNYLYYLATAPRFFGSIATHLSGNLLIEDPEFGMRRTSVVIEKPFGQDLESARELNRELLQYFSEQQIYRIDHYLGKETVQNILVFRFANGIFEPLWNHHYVDHIQISVCESVGVGSRAGYFDSTGILRDVVQNHLLQMLSLICIEPPHSLSDADSIRDEKVKVLRSLRVMKESELAVNTVRARYRSGFIEGAPVPGYLDEQGIDRSSETETFTAMKLEIDNWRWSGVPIYIRAGKRLPKRITEISLVFKEPPRSMFAGRNVDEFGQNVLAIQVQPKEGISLSICSKPPGPRLRVRPVVMDFRYHESFAVASPEAYERLLLDAMKGDATLFTRNDEIEEAWAFIDPVVSHWMNSSTNFLEEYEAGTWGPRKADALIEQEGRKWRVL